MQYGQAWPYQPPYRAATKDFRSATFFWRDNEWWYGDFSPYWPPYHDTICDDATSVPFNEQRYGNLSPYQPPYRRNFCDDATPVPFNEQQYGGMPPYPPLYSSLYHNVEGSQAHQVRRTDLGTVTIDRIGHCTATNMQVNTPKLGFQFRFLFSTTSSTSKPLRNPKRSIFLFIFGLSLWAPTIQGMFLLRSTNYFLQKLLQPSFISQSRIHVHD